MFALLMLFLGVILHTMSSGKSLQLLCTLPFGMLFLSAISMMFVKLCWQCDWWVWWSERKRTQCVFRKFCPVSFLVVCECRFCCSLEFIVMSYVIVVMMCRW